MSEPREVWLTTARINANPGEGLPMVRVLPGAKCAEADPEIWFPDTGRMDLTRQAKRICNGTSRTDACPVRAECEAEVMAAEGDLGRSSRHGVVAGLTPNERARLARLRRSA